MGKPGAEESSRCCTRKGWGGRVHFNEAAEEDRGWLPGQRLPAPMMLGHAAGIKAALGIIRWERGKNARPATA